MAIDERLRELLRCPKCKGKLQHQEEPEYLTCLACQLRYPVRDGIPVMLVEEAEPLQDRA